MNYQDTLALIRGPYFPFFVAKKLLSKRPWTKVRWTLFSRFFRVGGFDSAFNLNASLPKKSFPL
jgi:hypothetical protein